MPRANEAFKGDIWNLELLQIQQVWPLGCQLFPGSIACLASPSLMSHFCKKQRGIREKRLNWYRMTTSDIFIVVLIFKKPSMKIKQVKLKLKSENINNC